MLNQIDTLISDLETEFLQNKNSVNAEKMSAYMKGKFAFYGIKSESRRKISKPFIDAFVAAEYKEIESFCLALFKKEQREFHYVVVDLLRKVQKKLPEESFALIEKLIITNSWWDTVDALATSTLGVLCEKYPDVKSKMKTWIDSDNLWIRRSALLYQLKYKEETDIKELFEFCEKRMQETDFFIRKAIGWVLRECTRWYPQEVIHFVEKNKSQLSPLSMKEALRNLK